MYIFNPYQLREIARKSSYASETGYVTVLLLFYGCKPASKSKKYIYISDLFEASRYKTIRPKLIYFFFIINTLYHVILLTSDDVATFYLFVFFIIAIL